MEDQDVKGQEVQADSKRAPKVVDRVTLGSEESIRVADWINQLELASKGYLDLTKSDFINFLVREHARELSAKEIKLIRARHYDPVRHLNWITPRLKEALAKSDMAQVAILQDEIRSIELSVIANVPGAATDDMAPVKPRRKKRKSKYTIDEVELANS